jgi:pimeloyl-ACP methyl ester carboxylesterase
VLLHGAPTSSFMFRGLIPLLAGDYHVVAPDLLGFGLSDAPAVEEFDYTFEALTDSVAALLDELGLDRYAIYVQDYGAPVGWRLALRHPERRPLLEGLSLERIRWQYTHGIPDPTLVDFRSSQVGRRLQSDFLGRTSPRESRPGLS